MKLLIVIDVVGWAYWRRALALKKHSPPEWSVDIATEQEVNGDVDRVRSADIIFVIDYSQINEWRLRLNCWNIKIPLVVSHNTDSGRRHDYFLRCHQFADYVICNNLDSWMYFGKRPKTCCISNGVDLDVFRVQQPMESRPLRCLWTGSSNPRKGKGYEVICKLADLLPAYEFDLNPINDMDEPNKRSTEEIVDWYNSGSVVLCASRYEGTPNTTLEGMACGCIPVSTPVGNIREMGVHMNNCMIVCGAADVFAMAVKYAIEHRESMSKEAVRTIRLGRWSWYYRSQCFFYLFEQLLGGVTPEPFSYEGFTDGPGYKTRSTAYA